MQAACDIAVVGSGFAGSLIALIAQRLGRSVALLEKGRHPRFAIGESSTPIANLLLEELSNRYHLAFLKPFTKHGSWIAAHPEIGVGLKRGFTFYHHEFGREFVETPDHRNELLVAASPNDRIADTHWYRPDFDAFLVEQARQAGVTFIDQVEPWGVDLSSRRAVIQGRHDGKMLEIHADFIIDASGPRGFLHRSLELPEIPLRKIPPTQGLYAHFRGVKRWEDLHPPAGKSPPYPVDDAAMHHVFEGGWIWVLRFNNGITSAGAALEAKLANELRAAEGAAAWQRLLDRLPSVRGQFSEASAATPFFHSRQLSFLSGDVAGEKWALLPSAAGFIDPLLSTGFPLTLLGVQRLAAIIESSWGQPGFRDDLCSYAMQTTLELATAERLIGALYATMGDFEIFRDLSLLYFAAASFTESARRLGKPHLAGNTFLLGEHASFGGGLRACAEAALQRPSGATRERLLKTIRATIDPVNIAQLGSPRRHHWYPAVADDLRQAHHKLQSSTGEIDAMVRRTWQ